MNERSLARKRARAAVLVALAGAVATLLPSPARAVADTPAGVDADLHTLRTPPLADGQFELLPLSTMADTVTGGDVLLAVRGLDDAQRGALVVTRDGTDVTSAFAPVGEGEVRGLVRGLALGDNVIVATAGDQAATLVVRNHPVTGPVISGPHQTPFFCRTEQAELGAPLDEDCSATPRYQWFYRSSQDQGFHELADPYAPYPDDVATTETEEGEAVPFVVRVESRTINRGIARMALLDDPAARGADGAFEPTSWNGKVYYAFGESCGVGYQQGTNHAETVLGAIDLTEISADNLLINLTGITTRLGKGDITIHSTLSSFGVHCNPLVSVETVMMIKEHLIETYGPITALVGTNGSGAALQQYNAANNAPGLISAAMPTATFADIVTTAMTVTDCGLLQHYYANSELDWSDQKKAAVNGHNLLSGNELNAICQSWTDAFLSRIDPSAGCAVPQEQRYDTEDNPTGVRCTIQDANVNVFGRDPDTGFARRPLDNVGVQYGLDALEAGAISIDEFLDLNEKIGGYDIDGHNVPERHEMSSEVASIAYRLGGVIGRGALAETPVLDLAPYLDLIPVANIHESVRPFVVRARLRNQTHQDETQIIWRGLLTQADGYDRMAEWLDNLEDTRPAYGGDHMAAVRAARPGSLVDSCAFGTIGGRLDLPSSIAGPLGLVELPLLPGFAGPDVSIPLTAPVPEDFDSGLGPCSVALPVVRTPRMVAGMPLSDDVIKCQLRDIDEGDYPGALTDEQLARLDAVFPDGVCDFTKPAAEDVEHSMQWVSVGGTQLEAPHELTWRVARSVEATAASPATPARLPATGGRAPLLLAATAIVAAFALRRLSRSDGGGAGRAVR